MAVTLSHLLQFYMLICLENVVQVSLQLKKKHSIKKLGRASITDILEVNYSL